MLNIILQNIVYVSVLFPLLVSRLQLKNCNNLFNADLFCNIFYHFRFVLFMGYINMEYCFDHRFLWNLKRLINGIINLKSNSKDFRVLRLFALIYSLFREVFKTLFLLHSEALHCCFLHCFCRLHIMKLNMHEISNVAFVLQRKMRRNSEKGAYLRLTFRGPVWRVLVNFALPVVWLYRGFFCPVYCLCSRKKARWATCFYIRSGRGYRRRTDCSCLYRPQSCSWVTVTLSRTVSETSLLPIPPWPLMPYALIRSSSALHSVALTCNANLIGSQGNKGDLYIFFY